MPMPFRPETSTAPSPAAAPRPRASAVAGVRAHHLVGKVPRPGPVGFGGQPGDRLLNDLLGVGLPRVDHVMDERRAAPKLGVSGSSGPEVLIQARLPSEYS